MSEHYKVTDDATRDWRLENGKMVADLVAVCACGAEWPCAEAHYKTELTVLMGPAHSLRPSRYTAIHCACGNAWPCGEATDPALGEWWTDLKSRQEAATQHLQRRCNCGEGSDD